MNHVMVYFKGHDTALTRFLVLLEAVAAFFPAYFLSWIASGWFDRVRPPEKVMDTDLLLFLTAVVSSASVLGVHCLSSKNTKVEALRRWCRTALFGLSIAVIAYVLWYFISVRYVEDVDERIVCGFLYKKEIRPLLETYPIEKILTFKPDARAIWAAWSVDFSECVLVLCWIAIFLFASIALALVIERDMLRSVKKAIAPGAESRTAN